MKKNGIALCVLLGLVDAADAQDGTLAFKGQVEATTCVVQPISNGPIDGMDFTVSLPSISQYSLSAAGQRGAAIPFHVVVGSGPLPCQQTNVRALFSSVGDTNAAGRLSNQGTAGNVDVAVQNEQRDDVDLNTNENSQVVPVDRTGIGVLTWYASYYATGPASAGSVAARVQYTLVYP